MPRRLTDALYLATYVGLNFQQALYQAARDGFIIRVVKREGDKPYMLTQDFRTDRINLSLDRHEVVVQATNG